MTKLEGLRDFTVEESKNLYDYFFNEIKNDNNRIDFLSGSWLDKVPKYTSQISNFSNIINLVDVITKKNPQFLEKILKVNRNFECIVDALSNPQLLNNNEYNHNYIGRAMFNKETGLIYQELSPLLKKFFTSINAEIILNINDIKGMKIESVNSQFWVDSIVEANKRMSVINSFTYYDSCTKNLKNNIDFLNKADISWLEKVSTEDLTSQSNINMLNGSVFLYKNLAQLALLNYDKIDEPESFKKIISLLPPEAILKPIEDPYSIRKQTVFGNFANSGKLNDTSLNYFIVLSESNPDSKKDIVLMDYVMRYKAGDLKNKLSISGVAQFLNFMDKKLLNLVMNDGTHGELKDAFLSLEKVDLDLVINNKNIWKEHPFVISWAIDEKLKKILMNENKSVADSVEQFKL